MKSKFVKTVYEKNGFCIYVYVTEEKSVPQAARSNYYKGPGYEFTAIGNNLPANKLSEVDLHGDWEKNSHGVQFKVDYFEEIRPQSVEGIESYLSLHLRNLICLYIVKYHCLFKKSINFIFLLRIILLPLLDIIGFVLVDLFMSVFLAMIIC